MRNRALVPLAALPLLLLAACAPGGAGGTGGDGGSSDGGGAGTLDCSTNTTAGYELFVDPRLAIDPQADVYSLQTSGDVISFVDTPPEDVYTTYGYSLTYLDGGQAFPNDAAIFIGAEQTRTFELAGPQAPSGIDGGPYAAFLSIDATTDAGTTTIATLCVVLATAE